MNQVKTLTLAISALISLVLCNSCGSYYSDELDYSTSYRVNEIWTDWKGMDLNFISLHGNYSNIKIVRHDKPWITICHFYTNSSISMDATNNWEYYSGYIEYYVSDQYPTIYSQFTRTQFTFSKDYNSARYANLYNGYIDCFPFAVTSETEGAVKRTAKARIAVEPHKKNKIETYNIHFDGVGFGLCLRNLKFK